MLHNIQIINSDCLAALRGMEAGSVHCCVTSPPYWGLRDYGVAGQIGLERTPEEYVARMVEVFSEVRRVLREDGTCWVNLGDSYYGRCMTGGNNGINASGGDDGFKIARQFKRPNSKSPVSSGKGLKPKDLIGIPWRVAFAMQADGWYLRSDIIWHKINPMPESVTDRPTKAHEYVFLLTKSAEYFYDAEAIKEPVGGGAHARKANGANSRMVTERAAGREDSKPNPSRGNVRARGDARPPGVGPKTSPAGSGIKANDSYSAAVIEMVGSRNKRDVLPIASAPYSEAHFATFPPNLIKPCILAGTSARGCCPDCGGPWERIMQDGEPLEEWKQACGADSTGEYHGQNTKDYERHKAQPASTVKERILRGMVEKKTIGWKPTCECGGCQGSSGASPSLVAGTVLDPFGGSGTTGQVALELGRRAVLIELNPSYIPLIERRTNVTPGLKF